MRLGSPVYHVNGYRGELLGIGRTLVRVRVEGGSVSLWRKCDVSRRRRRTHCKRGHLLTERANGKRECRECSRIRERQRYWEMSLEAMR